METSHQNCCVFVGNIPYDTTEEQLIEICQEVGPVVSFRLVKDRDTEKPKGYGFCEHKDEETALSARRNLQDYEINGRKLRVNFADRNREQVVAPEEAANNHQPIGLHIAIKAATVMEAATQGGHQNGLTHDPLTLHLAKLSRNQLTEIISEVKAMATYNPQSARHLLLSRPQLAKALFQAEIMLGMVTPQVLQIPDIGSSSGEKRNGPSSDSEPFSRPSKKIKLDDGKKYSSFCSGVTNEKHFSQLPSDLQSLLLQQVRSLTPEQLSSLPPEQQQQVLQLQQALRT